MEVAFFTEMGFSGKVPRNHSNMRTEFAWMVALNADHYNINENLTKSYDLGIVIIPKKNPNVDLDRIRRVCWKVAVMQEGPHWYFQDYSIKDQINYYNTLVDADAVFAHNSLDVSYYRGITGKSSVFSMPSLMIEDAIPKLELKHREGVVIGGNFVSWYGGFDSYIVARSQFEHVSAPSMGRKQTGEDSLVRHIPYVQWRDWLYKLNQFEVGIHLMRTHAAGTFALNCAYLGIPCIGYKGLDTQEICHPDLSVELGDVHTAKLLLAKLKNNKKFYKECSTRALERYQSYYTEEKFLRHVELWKEKLMNG